MDEEWRFSRPLRLSNWKRFHTYANRVRSLQIDDDDKLSGDLINEVFRKMTMTMVTCLTPRLAELSVCRSDLAIFSQAFMHSGLRKIDIVLPLDTTTFEELMDILASRTKELEEVCFYRHPHTLEADVLDKELSSFFLLHRRLQSLTIPELTISIVKILPQLESLMNIYTRRYRPFSAGADFNVDSMPSLRLTNLMATLSFQDATTLISHLPNLEVLGILARWAETSSSLQSLITTASQTCSFLKNLEIDGIPDEWNYGPAREDKSAYSVTLITLSALEKVSTLEELQIFWPYPLNITEDNLARLLPCLPNLSSLHLNPSHIVLDDDAGYQLPLSILPKISEWCPKIQELGLLLNCKGVVVDLSAIQSAMDLKTLNLGFSHVDDSSTQLAHYLSYYCSESCSFEGGQDTWSDDFLVRWRLKDEYGDDYAKGRWDREREDIQRVFQIVKEVKSQLDALAKEREAHLKEHT